MTETRFQFDLETVPFSRRGSYLAFSLYGDATQQQIYRPTGRSEHQGVYLRTVRNGGECSRLLHIELLVDGAPAPCQVTGSPALLRLSLAGAPERCAEFCIVNEETVRVRARGVGLRLSAETDDSPFDNAFSPDGVRVHVICFRARLKLALIPLSGALTLDAPWSIAKSDYIRIDLQPAPGATEADCVIEGFDSTLEPRTYTETFEAQVAAVESDYAAWLAATLPVPEPYAATRELAAYINWSCTVRPRGYLTRPAMFMSKNWMARIWSWDNCFNALGLARQDPALAWDQLLIFFDHQDRHGALPDHLVETGESWSFYKPPIHGWAVRELLRRQHEHDTDRLRALYEPLCRWTDWWFTYRDDDGDGIPQYNHGNDSGWDNGTAFSAGVPVECPDLSAYLILQMDTLAQIAGQLGHDDDQRQWSARADALLERMIDHFWTGDRFVSRRSGSHDVPAGDTLLNYLPLVLGTRLPQPQRAALAAGLQRFLTPHGLATEHPDSPLYEPDGYWRGPIWAPSTMLIFDGLLNGGYPELAATIAERFCAMAARSGMAENYDALTGEGLRDRAYTWTASVFLLLANHLLERTAP